MAALLLGLVLMHHASGHTEHDGAHPAPHLVAPLLAASFPDTSAGPEATAPNGCPCPADVPPLGEPDLLHLCLAIAGVAALLLSRLLPGLPRPRPSGTAPGTLRSALAHLAPPPPVPRRLAALGVLRR